MSYYYLIFISLQSSKCLITILWQSYFTLPHFSSVSEEKWAIILIWFYYCFRIVLKFSHHRKLISISSKSYFAFPHFSSPLEENCLITVLELPHYYLITVSEVSYYHLIKVLFCSYTLLPCSRGKIKQFYYCLRIVSLLSHHSPRSVLLPSYHSLILLLHTSPLCQKRIEQSYYCLRAVL